MKCVICDRILMFNQNRAQGVVVIKFPLGGQSTGKNQLVKYLTKKQPLLDLQYIYKITSDPLQSGRKPIYEY